MLSSKRTTVPANKRAIDALKPDAARYSVAVEGCPGLEVRVTPAGIKTYAARLRVPGAAQPSRVTLGTTHDLTVQQARERTAELRSRARAGEDAAAQRRARREAPTVAALCTEYLIDCEARLKPTTVKEYRRLLDAHILPAWGTMKVADIQGAHASRLHRSLSSTPYQANRVLALTAAFFTFAIRNGERLKGSSPADDVEAYREEGSERFLNEEEVGRLFKALDDALSPGIVPAPSRRRSAKVGKTAKHRPKNVAVPKPANPTAVAALRMLALTGWRENEVLKLRWEEVNLDRGTAMLRDTKTGGSARVISETAVALLREMPRRHASPYVFASPTSPLKPLADVGRLWDAVRHAADLEGVRLHDLRHTAASLALAAGVPLAHVGKLLGHKNWATTAKYGHLDDEAGRAAAEAVSAAIARARAEGKGTKGTKREPKASSSA